jgi:hypothetical protein
MDVIVVLDEDADLSFDVAGDLPLSFSSTRS